MKLLDKIKVLPKIIKAAFVLDRAWQLQVSGKSTEALNLLNKHKEILNGKSISYHLNCGRLLFIANYDYKCAIEEFSQGVSLINSKKKLKSDKREYLLAWTKYMIALCYEEMGEKETAERWRTEYKMHKFDIDRVSKITKKEFPIS